MSLLLCMMDFPAVVLHSLAFAKQSHLTLLGVCVIGSRREGCSVPPTQPFAIAVKKGRPGSQNLLSQAPEHFP